MRVRTGSISNAAIACARPDLVAFPRSRSPMADTAGRLIAGKYELLTPAGEGGMAVVWKSIARGAGSFTRTVAIKRITAGKHADPSFIKMFEEEARVGSQLHHPNIVQILDFGRDEEGGYYLVMEWMEGLDLFQWVRSFPRGSMPTPWPLVAAIGIEVLRGLSAAHEREGDGGGAAPVFHRDVSPSNILLGSNGTVKLTDFGLARAMDRASMTRPNVIKGKLAYTAPELIAGAKAGPRTDVFGLGVVLWEALAQRRLFTGKNDLEVLLAVRKGDVPRLSTERSDLPAPLIEVIAQSLATSPDERYQTAREMARALASVLRSSTELTDAEPLGQSVRAARVRLGKDKDHGPLPVDAAPPAVLPAAGLPAAGPVMSSESLSVSDLEAVPVEVMAPETARSDDKTSPAKAGSRDSDRKPRGVWKSDSSTAVPAQKKR